MAKEGQDLVMFGLLNFAETYRLQDLKDIASALGLALPHHAKHIEYMEALVDCKEIIGDVKKSVMELVAARLAKRSRRSIKRSQPMTLEMPTKLARTKMIPTKKKF